MLCVDNYISPFVTLVKISFSCDTGFKQTKHLEIMKIMSLQEVRVGIKGS